MDRTDDMSLTSGTNQHYLRSIHIDAFGSMMQRNVGPFVPGLNVVFGANEAGKTTVCSFVKGVLFGWEEARGRRNVYKPVAAQRSGSLVFATDDESSEIRCERTRNADGIDQEAEAYLLRDIDKETFDTVFSLDSDELRRLGNTTDVTARLLTAGAGTTASPARALQTVNARLASCMSRAASNPDSIPNLRAAVEEVQGRLDQAASQAQRYKHEDAEFRSLASRRSEVSASLSQINAEIENLSVQLDALGRLDVQAAEIDLQAEQAALEEDALQAAEDFKTERSATQVPAIDSVEERALREAVDEMSREQSDIRRSLSLAQQSSALSKATYDAIAQDEEIQAVRTRAHKQHLVRIALSVLLPVMFTCAGVLVFLRGRQISSLSITALGAILVMGAVMVAVAAVVMLFKPSKTQEEAEQRVKDAQWVMMQDEKKVDACAAQLAAHDQSVCDFLEAAGLAEAEGSLHRARALLDDIRESRADDSVLNQRRKALAAQWEAIETARVTNARHRAEALEAAGEPDGTPVLVIEAKLKQKMEQRDALMRTSESLNARYGELKKELALARHFTQFDELKLERAVLSTRLDEAYAQYAQLLLEKRVLDAAIAAWEGESQPKVYQKASELFGIMTDGAWQRVRIGQDGQLEAVDAFDQIRPVNLLSLGTCQQLYLSLRLALLMTAQDTGRSLPVLADDILVNFDDVRRRGAARALARLAQHRQVIIFTCHHEVVELLEEICADANLVEL